MHAYQVCPSGRLPVPDHSLGTGTAVGICGLSATTRRKSKELVRKRTRIGLDLHQQPPDGHSHPAWTGWVSAQLIVGPDRQ
jgi:hypothetical protein